MTQAVLCATFPPVMKPLRSLLLATALIFGGFTIGLEVTGRLEPFLEPILAFFAGPEEPRFYLVPVDFNPFPDELDI